MIYTSHTPLTAGCFLTKSKFLLVLIVIPHRIPFERCLDLSIPYVDMLLGPQKSARGTALEESQTDITGRRLKHAVSGKPSMRRSQRGQVAKEEILVQNKL